MQNILIFPSGTEIAFEIFNALKDQKYYTIYGGTSADDHSKFVYKNLIIDIPFVTDKNFINKINEIIANYNIDYIYPAHDIAIEVFANIEDQINAKIVTSPKSTVLTLRSKLLTYEHLSKYSFIPKYYNNVNEIHEFPVFIKPQKGQGAQGTKKINTVEELEHELQSSSNLIICEYLGGTEYTVDCFTDKNGTLQTTIMRERARIKTGISVRANSLHTPKEVEDIAHIINSEFTFNGAWFFQLKLNSSGKYKLLEISPRIPGTMGCTRMKGINYPLLTLYNMQGYDVKISPNTYEVQLDRAFISRHKININYDTIYVDLDDTLIIKDQINYSLLTLLYQNKSKERKNILISRHAKNIKETLNKFAISENLFSEIIHILSDKKKSSYIKDQNSIFIDDSFRERIDVQQNCKINVFDVDMIESLLDWRK
ncbi:MAG: ATP-grasp domain-containing protein [Eubacteriales bacterium]